MGEITSILREILPGRKYEKGLTLEDWNSLLEKKNKALLGKNNIPPRFVDLDSGSDEGFYFTIVKDPKDENIAIFCNSYFPRKDVSGVKEKSFEDSLNNAVLITSSGPVFYQENIKENERIWQQVPEVARKGKLTVFYDYFSKAKLFDPNKDLAWWGNVPDMNVFRQLRNSAVA